VVSEQFVEGLLFITIPCAGGDSPSRARLPEYRGDLSWRTSYPNHAGFPDALVGLPSVTLSGSLLPMVGKRRLGAWQVVA
jgi:hypothetical protein